VEDGEQVVVKKSSPSATMQACDRRGKCYRGTQLLLLLVPRHNVILVDVARAFAAKSRSGHLPPHVLTNKTRLPKQKQHGAEAALRPP